MGRMSRADSPADAPSVAVTTAARDGAGQARVAAGLRTAIQSGEFAPGARLVEADLMDLFGVSRAGVRLALAELAADGLVERVQNKGARVRVVGIAEAVEIVECRMALEGLCAAKAAGRATAAEHAELRGLIDRMRAAAAAGDALGASELGHQVHRRIQEISGQVTAQRTIERLRGQLVRHQFRLALRPGRARESLREHAAVVEAVVAGDPEKAEAVMREHLRQVARALEQGAYPAPGFPAPRIAGMAPTPGTPAR